MKPCLSELEKTESVVALLLPGPQLLSDMNEICEDFKTVAVNHHVHGVLNPDYMVCADKLGRYPPFDRAYHTQPVGTRISAHPEMSDYKISGYWWYGFGSASLAFWVSCLMAERVYVCGADLYQSEQRFFNEEVQNPYIERGLDWQLDSWKKAPYIAKRYGTEIIIVSGPLKKLFN